MAYISQITPLGSSTTYDLKAAMLTHTPNNTTTFLRGDNTWSNTLTGNLLLSKDANTEWANSPQLQLTGADSKIAGIKLTNSGTNLDIGWDWTARTGAGLGLRSTSATDTTGGFYLFARNASAEYNLTGTVGGDLTWSGKHLYVAGAGETYVRALNTNTSVGIYLDSGSTTESGGIWSNGYNTGSAFTSSGKWMMYRNNSGDVILNGNAATSSSLLYAAQKTTAADLDAFHTANQLSACLWNGWSDTDIASASYPGVTNGIILDGGYNSTNYGFQIAIDDDPTGFMALRQKNGSGWQAWKRIPMGDGTGANGTWGINISGTAAKLTNLSSTDQASSSSTQRYVWFAYNDNVTGRPAYDANFVYRSDTKTLTIPRINLWRDGATTYGRLQWYHHNYKTWTNYMSNAASGTCPSGGTPSTLGNVTSWAIRSYIENSSGYGWLWESAAESNTGTPTARMALSSYDGTLEVAGLVKITKNSNTTTIGSQNTTFCHIYNSANIPFIFNNTVATTTGNLGTNAYPWNNLYIGPSNGAGIYYKGTKNTYRMIRFIDNTTDNYGNGISIGGGGQTIIGGGESADTAVAQAGTAGAESMWICNDGAIEFYPNLQNGWTTSYKNYIDTSGYYHGIRVYGAVWNDYAEYRKDNPNEIQEPGRCVKELGNGALTLTTKRLERGCEIISDTFGFGIGQDEENGYNTPIASNGRVLAYPYESIEEFADHIGWPVCSGPNGTVSIMTEKEEEKYPSRIIGTISEIPTYEEWGTGNVKVNGRIWIRIR